MKYFLLFVPILIVESLKAQNTIGTPSIVNYSKLQYQGGGQTWDVDTDKRGMMYFANNEGLLTFNGNFWKLHPVPNNTRLRSVKVDTTGRIYVGAQDEFGYYLPDENGSLHYTSLKPLIPAGQQGFADIWNIALYDGGIFFRSSNKIFEYRHNSVKVHNAPGQWRMMTRNSKGLFAQDQREGLLQYGNGRWKSICREFADRNMLVTAVLDHRADTLLIATLKDGMFRLSGDKLIPQRMAADSIFRSCRIYCATDLAGGQLAIGTAARGCYIVDKESGNILQQFTIDEGLQNNNVLKLFADAHQNIWLALDNGIDLLRYNTAIKQIHPDKRNFLTTYAARVFGNRLFIGTTDGLFSTQLDSSKDFSSSKNGFQPVAHTKGQVWNLSEAGGHLLLGHHEGTFEIRNNTATPLLKDVGCWLYKPLPSTGAATDVLVGSYNGLQLMRTDGKVFTAIRRIPGLFESLRFLTVDKDNVVWASHPYRGVFRISLSGDSILRFRLYTRQNGLPSDNNNFVFDIKHKVVVATQAGIYEYDGRRDAFIRSPLLYPLLNAASLQYLTEDANGNIWFVSNKKPGVIDFNKPSGRLPYSVIYFPELTGKIVSGFELIYPYNDENIFLGGEKGLYHINYRKYSNAGAGPSVLLGQISAAGKKDSLLFGGYAAGAPPKGKVALPHGFNSFHFEYASPAYDQDNGIEYSYQLAGFDKQPSEWTTRTEKEYTNLPYGRYTFSVKARDNRGNESAPASYSFSILPAWYQSGLARLCYAILFTAVVFAIYQRQQKRFAAQQQKHREEQEHLIFLHQLERERDEKALMQLQNEKLETEVQFKNKELATATMHLLQRGKLLSNIKEELTLTIKKIDPPSLMPHFKKTLRLFEEAENNEEDWEHFSHHFDEVHNNFLSLIKKRFPDLSTTDLKLCAYLRINLTTKEIAQSMGISVRGVETSRYRLRKKLDIPNEAPLYDFLIASTDNP